MIEKLNLRDQYWSVCKIINFLISPILGKKKRVHPVKINLFSIRLIMLIVLS